LDGAGVVGEEAECAAGFDGAELGGVTEQSDDCAAFACVVGEPVELAGAGHACFDGQQVAGVEDVPGVVSGSRVMEFAGRVGVAELVQVLGAAAEFLAENLGGHGRGG
jgi:hypothetical protein